MSAFDVREAGVSDAEAIASVHVRTWQFAYRGQLPEDFLSQLSVEERAKRWREMLVSPKPKTKVYVAEAVGTIVGFGSVGPSRDKDAEQSMGELYAVYIDAQNMGKGAGSALMQAGLEYLRSQGFKKAILWVLASNDKARKFYESKGWTLTGKTEVDKRDEVDLHVVQYDISL
ncbi:MAG: GNAT family N-acetyltransferase [Patescibacteria group bacterium]